MTKNTLNSKNIRNTFITCNLCNTIIVRFDKLNVFVVVLVFFVIQ